MRSDAYRRFCAKLVEARTLRQLTQADVARALGWRQPLISEMETGERQVTAVEFHTLATFYKKPLKWFFPD